ncbi:MAG: hypothetical protein K0Q47_1461 [Sedimentibacter sp.]|nr:hypothetical protein [Sedimentibacter sp.]
MEDIVLDLKGSFVAFDEMKNIEPEIMNAQETLLDKKGISSEMTGWIDFMDTMDKEEYEKFLSWGESCN